MNCVTARRTLAVGLVQVATVVMASSVVAWTIDQRSSTADEALGQLREIGRKIASAVLSYDTEALLAYDRSDLRAEDRESLRDTSNALYCFLFDHRCNANSRPSIYDTLSRSKRLEIDVQLIRGTGSPPHGWLLFFDASKISRANLRSAAFLCRHSDQVASWLFKFEDGEWVSANPIFDSETDTLCSPR